MIVAKVSKKDPQHRSHLLTASGRFKHLMATLQENFNIKTIQETGLIT